MPTFITPFSGSAELTASNGLDIVSQASWRFSQSGYNDGASFGVSLGGPLRPAPEAATATPQSGELHLRAQNWPIADIGNTLTSYTDPGSGITYGAERCRIEVRGRWNVGRRPNPNSFNGQGVLYTGRTETDEGNRDMSPFLLNFVGVRLETYIIQGSAVAGGALDTFSNHVFFCRVTETATTDNSNREFQSNSLARPVWQYSYAKSWQID
jgi:hypothetical protein